ncbi:MAG: enoyl-CoA hydratase [Zetaproteobacteria bacterium]|nr:MAG: enoyl-CoA hydratase [Zetaproteobacteria bacterium]
MQIQTNLQQQRSLEEEFTSLEVIYEEKHQLAWYYIKPYPRQCCTPELINDIQNWYSQILNSPLQEKKYEYIVIASKEKGIFNLGGDLNLFSRLIKNRDRDRLLGYALSCINTLYLNHTSLGKDVTTISLVQGDALGGGMEFAISSNILIAEKSAKMGMPEILFNLFPGMGAYSLLSRKIGAIQAEKIILSGKLYTADEMFELGVVDILVEDGEGKKAVYDYIKSENRARNGIQAFRKAKKCTDSVTYDELEKVTNIWVDAALKLNDRDLRMMERLVKRQTVKFPIPTEVMIPGNIP